MNNIIDRLAEVVHDAWMEWSKTVAPVVPEEKKKSWEQCWVNYNVLPEFEKEKDRKIARRLLSEMITIDATPEEVMSVFYCKDRKEFERWLCEHIEVEGIKNTEE